MMQMTSIWTLKLKERFIFYKRYKKLLVLN